MSGWRMAFAITVFTTLTALLHRYVWARLIRDPAWNTPWATALAIAIFALAALMPLALPAMRWAPRVVNVPLAWVVFTWMGFLFYLFVLVLVSDAGRGIANLLGVLPKDPERRQFLARVIAGGVAGVAGLLGIGGLGNVARGFIEQAVKQTNALAPDLIVITGDLVDGTVEQLREHVAPLADLRAKDGVYFVTGNHEYYSGADDWLAHLTTLGIRVLRNERVDVRGLFDLAGVDDASARRILPHHGQDVAKAVAGRDPSRMLVLLAHQPKAFKHAVAAGVDLQLSGHVHGGQLVPFNWLVKLDQPYVSGLHQVNDSWIYVSPGTGYWGPPMRVGTVSELTH